MREINLDLTELKSNKMTGRGPVAHHAKVGDWVCEVAACCLLSHLIHSTYHCCFPCVEGPCTWSTLNKWPVICPARWVYLQLGTFGLMVNRAQQKKRSFMDVGGAVVKEESIGGN